MTKPLLTKVIHLTSSWIDKQFDKQDLPFHILYGAAPIPGSVFYLCWLPLGQAYLINAQTGTLTSTILNFHPKHTLLSMFHVHNQSLFLFSSWMNRVLVAHKVIIQNGSVFLQRSYSVNSKQIKLLHTYTEVPFESLHCKTTGNDIYTVPGGQAIVDHRCLAFKKVVAKPGGIAVFSVGKIILKPWIAN